MARTIANPPDIRADVAKSRTTLATSHHFSSSHHFWSFSRPICRVSGAESDVKMAAWSLAVLPGEAPWIIRDRRLLLMHRTMITERKRAYGVRNFRDHGKPSAGVANGNEVRLCQGSAVLDSN